MSKGKEQDGEEYDEYRPVEGLRGIFSMSNTEIASTGAKINTRVPTAEEIASGKYVRRRYWPMPRWMRWLFGTE